MRYIWSQSSDQCEKGLLSSRCALRYSRAFTMLELLVVIVVVGVLLSIVLPALASVRRNSGEIRCLCNIRDSSVAIALYATRNHDRLPVPGLVSDNRSIGRGPRARITCDQTWIETDYFGSGSWWGAVIRAQSREPQASTWTCGGFREASQLDPALWGYPVKFALCDSTAMPSTYVLSDAFLALPNFWRPGDPQLLEEAQERLLGMAASPSRKVLLFEMVVFHLFSAAVRTPDMKVPRAPVSFADSHAAVRDFREATPGVVNRFAPAAYQPIRNTENGVNGVDF